MYRNDEQHVDDTPIFSEEVLRSKTEDPEECYVCGTETYDPVCLHSDDVSRSRSFSFRTRFVGPRDSQPESQIPINHGDQSCAITNTP